MGPNPSEPPSALADPLVGPPPRDEQRVNGFGIASFARWLNARSPAERSVLLLGVLVGAIRLFYAVHVHPAEEFLTGEMGRHAQAAQHLAKLGRFAPPADAFLPSSLSLLLGTFLRVLGPRGQFAADLTLGFASALLLPAAFFLGRRLGGESVGKLAAVLAAFDLMAASVAGYELPDALAAAALAAAFLVFRPERGGRSFAAGVGVGLAAWSMPRLALLSVFWIAGLLARRRWASALGLALGTALVVAPVSLWASHRARHPALISPSFAGELALSVCPVASLSSRDGLELESGTVAQRAERAEPETTRAAPQLAETLLDSRASLALAASCVRRYRSVSVRLALRNLLDGLAGPPSSLVSPWPDWTSPGAFVAMWGNLAMSAIALLGVFGLVALRKHEDALWLLALPLGAAALGFVLFGGGPRFRLPWNVLVVAVGAQGWLLCWPRALALGERIRGWSLWAHPEWDVWKRVLIRVVPNRVLVIGGIWAGMNVFGAEPLGAGYAGGRPNVDNRLIDGLLRWDAHWYWHVAAQGYNNTGGQRDTAFFPLYPMLARAMGWLLGGDYYVGGLVVSNICFVFACYVLFKLVSLHYPRRIAERTLSLLLVYPFAFIFSSMYTESVFLLATLCTFYFAERNRWVLAGLAAAAASATRIPGILVTGGLGLLYLEKIDFDLRRIRPTILWVGLGGLGLLTHMAYLFWRFHEPLAFVHSQGVGGWSYPFRDALSMLSGMSWGQFAAGGLPVVGLVDIAGLTLGLIACVQCCRKLRWAYGVWGILTLVISANVWVGLGRYGVVIFPLYIFLAQWLRRTTSLQIWLTGSTILLAYFMLLFANWHFIL